MTSSSRASSRAAAVALLLPALAVAGKVSCVDESGTAVGGARCGREGQLRGDSPRVVYGFGWSVRGDHQLSTSINYSRRRS